MLVCPALRSARSGYALNENMRGAELKALDIGSCLLFEYSGGWSDWALPSKSLVRRHFGKRCHFVAVDGSVRPLSEDADLAPLDGPVAGGPPADTPLSQILLGGLPTPSSPAPPPPPPAAGPQPTPQPAPSLERYSSASGFSILKPVGWVAQESHDKDGSTLQFTGSDPNISCKVQWQSATSAPLDAYPLRTEGTWQKRDPHYHRIAMDPANIAGRSGLRWEFMRTVDGQIMHTVDLFVNCGDVGYAILCRAPEAEWSQHQGVFEQVLSSFEKS